MALELYVGLLHDSKVRVLLEHLGPFPHTLEYLGFHLLMRILSSVSSYTCNVPSTAPLRHTLSFANRNKASVKLRDASSVCILGPQFCDNAFDNYLRSISVRCSQLGGFSLTSRVYSCTFAFRCANRLIIAATASFALFGEEASTLSCLSYYMLQTATNPESSAPTRSQTS